MAVKKQVEKVANIAAFSKEQILKSKKYRDKRDMLNVLLQADKEYAFDDIDNVMNGFLKGKV